MSQTDESIIQGLVKSVSEPVFVIIPNKDMGDEGYVRLFKTLEEVLSKIEGKTGAEFDILVDCASVYGGYNALQEELVDQRAEIEAEQGWPGDEEEESENNSRATE